MSATHRSSPCADVSQAVTVLRLVPIGSSEVFAVQPGVPLADAMDVLSLLLGTAKAAAQQVAVTAESWGNPDAAWAPAPGTAWASVYLLDMAAALQDSIHCGLLAGGEA